MAVSTKKTNKVGNFLSILERHRVTGDGPYTHVTFDPPGKYYLRKEKKKGLLRLDQILTHYCNTVSGGQVLTLAELPATIRGGSAAVAPFRLDVDLKLPYKGEVVRHYTPEIVSGLIKCIHEVIEEFVDLTQADDYDDEAGENYAPYKCILLEKPDARKEDVTLKDGFHLHFPYFYVDAWTSSKIHQELIKKMAAVDLWGETPYAKHTDIIDSGAGTFNTWMMYGSAKSSKGTPYLATMFFDETITPIEPEVFFESEMEGRGMSVQYYLPRFLSIRTDTKATPLKKVVKERKNSEIRAGKKRAEQNSVTRTNNVQAQMDLTTLRDGGIMEMISKSRAHEFREWYRIGQALHTIGQGGNEGLSLWIDFSKRSSKYEEGECEILWGKMKQNTWHMGWLLKCARDDSPEDYNQWRNTGMDYLIKECLKEPKPTEWDVAQIFYKMYGDRFLCAEAKTQIWYEFRDHRWRKVDGILEAKKVLPMELINIFLEYAGKILKQMKGADSAKKTILDQDLARCMAIKSALKTESFQNKVIKQCAIRCHNPEFMLKKDENKNLWVCENGVLDLKEGIFREGRPDDMCTYSCGRYYKEFSHSDEEVKYLETIFEEVFINPNIRNFFLDSVCSVMEGGNPEKAFLIGTGSGSNGKSVVYALVRKMCGGTNPEGYVISFPPALFLEGVKENQGAARPDLAQARGKRLAVVNELTKKDKINITVIKELTGNDDFFSRGLYEKGGSIKPMFKLFMHTNEPPEMNGDDEASWERAFFVDFESKFILPAKLKKWPVPASRNDQIKMKRFHADQGLMEKISEDGSELVDAFLWMMFKRYKIYKQQGLVTPDEVLASTNEQRNKNDFYGQFTEECLTKVKYDPKKRKETALTLTEAFAAYQEWHKGAHPHTSLKVSKVHFQDELSKKIGKITAKSSSNKYWPGWVITSEDDEEGFDEGNEGNEGNEGEIEE